MSVAIAYQLPASTQLALREAIKQALFRGTDLVVIHVAETFDQDDADHYVAGISDDVEKALVAGGIESVTWRLELITPDHNDDVAETILRLATTVGAELLVIGARRRSPVGKALTGSVAQTIILNAEMAVLVVKA